MAPLDVRHAERIAQPVNAYTDDLPLTPSNQERRARLHIVPHLGQLPLGNITASELRAYTAKQDATVSSVDYRRGILSELSTARPWWQRYRS